MYMLLIVVLILSQDPRFSSNMHRFTLPSVPWYSERLLKDMPLGLPPAADLIAFLSMFFNPKPCEFCSYVFVTTVLPMRKLGLALVTWDIRRRLRVPGELVDQQSLVVASSDFGPPVPHALK